MNNYNLDKNSFEREKDYYQLLFKDIEKIREELKSYSAYVK